MTGENPLMPEVLEQLRVRLSSAAENIVPWFYDAMPEYYFKTHDREEQLDHLHALVSGKVATEGHVLALKSPCGTRRTFISPGGSIQALEEAIGQLESENILNARMYASLDGKLRLDTFIVEPQGVVNRNSSSFSNAIALVREAGMLSDTELDDFADFLATATGDCVDKFEVERAVRHYRIYKRIAGTDRVHVTRERNAYPGLTRVIVSMYSPPTHGALTTNVKILRRAGAVIDRAYADVYDTSEQKLGIMSFYIRTDGFAPFEDDEAWRELCRELKAVKWFASGHALEVYAEEEGWSVHRVMLLQAASEFAHQFLLKKDPYAYTANHIVDVVLHYREQARALVEVFEARFDPSRQDGSEEFRSALVHLRELCEGIDDDIAVNTFKVMELFISHTLRTNYYVHNRFGLAFRLDPAVLRHLPQRDGKLGGGSAPYGVYFFHGAHFQGFHVRYRNTARGGVRVVPTRSQANFELESNRLFDEVTALAKSQQHKNKDIPEGGSKAVILLGPLGDIDLAVRSVTNSLLDLILHDRDSFTLPGVVDHLEQDEIIYLGPDEHIEPKHIEWIVARAAKRKYRWPNAFMSSKPKTGINHKEYGVTSLGVIVFCEEMLKALGGIDPRKDPFTVKITGGPRGDVAGNAMKILMREYGENAKIVAISDGHGAAYDPDGLSHTELTRLIEGDLDVCAFDASVLTGQGAFALCTDGPEGIAARDTLHNTAKADLFIPAGGRPDTINDRNWEDFLDEDRNPTAKIIVEGANLFLSEQARLHLQNQGVFIAHGASANKAGVICSSYEILAGLVMSDEEFIAEKEEYVKQVLGILAERARNEVRLIIREYKACGGCDRLTDISMKLSKEINWLADRIDTALAEKYPDPKGLEQDPELYALLLSYCPAIMASKYRERIIEQVPISHLRALVAAFSASRAVYAEGIGWMRNLAERHDINDVLHAYLRQEKKLVSYIEGLVKSDAKGRHDIARILLATGRKFLTSKELGIEIE